MLCYSSVVRVHL